VATFYGDFRDAEANRFDYNEIGARLQVRYEPRDKWRITGRLKAYARDYKGSFSTDFYFARSDRRLAVEVDVRYQIDDNAHVFGAFGWEVNRSNIAIRDFSGPTFRLGVSVTFP
jgi:hypothetical protein